MVAGSGGMVGAAICRALEVRGFTDVLHADRRDVDLLDQRAVRAFFAAHRPQYVFLAAAKVGGILANREFRADFLYQNLMIGANVISAAHEFAVAKLLNLGSSCIYPREAPQPLREEYLLAGPLEETNEPYAVAKIATIKLCESFRRQYGCHFISAMPTNLYGPGDNFDLESAHVLPALMRKFHSGRVRRTGSVLVWGSGRPRREFMHVDDVADALVFLMDQYDEEQFINVGWGEDISIADLARLVAEVVGYEGGIEFDVTKPDGTQRKLMDPTRLRSLGWRPSIPLREGINLTYAWFLEKVAPGLDAQAD